MPALSPIDALICNLSRQRSEIGRVVVGVSGGADSLVLAEVCLAAGLSVVLAHCNFHLRGEESLRDEAFVRQWQAEHHPTVLLEVVHFDTTAYAAQKGLSIEMAARDLRYEWFENLRQLHEASRIAVAHHLNDQAETLLLHLARGTGGAGLLGMREQRGAIWRPLLPYSRSAIEAWGRARGLSWVDDSTNADQRIPRNLVRHSVIPLFEQLNPAFLTTLARSSEIFALEQEVIADLLADFLHRHWSSAEQLLDLRHSASERYLPLLLARSLLPRGFTAAQVDDLCQGLSLSGRTFPLKGGKGMAELMAGRLYFITPPAFPLYQLSFSSIEEAPPSALYFDPKGLSSHHFEMRLPQRGDRFTPIGMRGSKSVHDYLKERGIPRAYREHVPLLTYGDEVVAVLPLQISQHWALAHPSHTQQGLALICQPLSETTPLVQILNRVRSSLMTREEGGDQVDEIAGS